jgi:GNAT superfamily N-acetyltransferase
MEITEIGEDQLPQLVAVRNTVWPHDPESVEGYIDWRRQADDMTWLLARRDGEVVGAGVGIVGWHSPLGVGRATVLVLPSARGAGVGTAISARLASWLHEHGCREATGGISETDPSSIAWAERRGLVEVGRNSILALSLAEIDGPVVDPPVGVEIVTFAERPELARPMYEVGREAVQDIPGEEDAEIPLFEHWLANDMQGASDRADATFVALLEGEVVGWAKLSIQPDGREIAWHDLTAVRRAARGRGIAGCLKRAEIAWAKENGFQFLKTFNEERNEPIRRLNERHGYRIEPGFISVRGPIAG